MDCPQKHYVQLWMGSKVLWQTEGKNQAQGSQSSCQNHQKNCSKPSKIKWFELFLLELYCMILINWGILAKVHCSAVDRIYGLHYTFTKYCFDQIVSTHKSRYFCGIHHCWINVHLPPFCHESMMERRYYLDHKYICKRTITQFNQ